MRGGGRLEDLAKVVIIEYYNGEIKKETLDKLLHTEGIDDTKGIDKKTKVEQGYSIKPLFTDMNPQHKVDPETIFFYHTSDPTKNADKEAITLIDRRWKDIKSLCNRYGLETKFEETSFGPKNIYSTRLIDWLVKGAQTMVIEICKPSSVNPYVPDGHGFAMSAAPAFDSGGGVSCLAS